MEREREETRSSGSESLKKYLKEISRLPRITVQEERDLGARIQQGDTQALRRLVEANLRFVVSCAKRYRGCGLSFLDLIHEGNVGLIEAAKRFDPGKGVKFITYAGWWVRQAIVDALSGQSGAIRLPQHLLRRTDRIDVSPFLFDFVREEDLPAADRAMLKRAMRATLPDAAADLFDPDESEPS